jgi:predicted GNAT family acetyltransferase
MDGRKNNAISIEKRVAGTSGRYVGRIDGVGGEAELIFTVRGPSLISADHTEAPASMRGTGAAMALVEHMIGDARAKGFKITPLCPYVLAQYRKHPEWNDVMTSAASTP